MYPRSMFYTILDRVRPYLIDDVNSGALENKFAQFESGPEEQGLTTKDGFRKVFSSYGIFDVDGSRPDLITEHELVTLLRAGGNKTPYFSVKKFMEQSLRQLMNLTILSYIYHFIFVTIHSRTTNLAMHNTRVITPYIFNPHIKWKTRPAELPNVTGRPTNV